MNNYRAKIYWLFVPTMSTESEWKELRRRVRFLEQKLTTSSPISRDWDYEKVVFVGKN